MDIDDTVSCYAVSDLSSQVLKMVMLKLLFMFSFCKQGVIYSFCIKLSMWVVYTSLYAGFLIHLLLDKMTAISHTIFSDVFS